MNERMKCKWELCSRILASHATSGHCRYHQQRVSNTKRRRILKEKGICVCCGKREVKKIICPHCRGVVKSSWRCEICQENQRKSNRKHKAKEDMGDLSLIMSNF